MDSGLIESDGIIVTFSDVEQSLSSTAMEVLLSGARPGGFNGGRIRTAVCQQGGAMAVLVGVHGIAQECSTPERQLKLWADSLELGIARAGGGGSVPTLSVPFYGFLFREGSHYLGPDDQSGVFEPKEEAFVAAALEESLRGLSESELAELHEGMSTLGPPGVIPPAWVRGLAAVDRRWGGGMGLLRVGVLRQVYAYLHRVGAGDVIRQAVLNEVGADTRVLVGHSLGSVVVYDLLRRGQVPQVSTLVTLGSPLGLGAVRRALDASFAGSDIGAVRWFNVYDKWDVVTGGKGLELPALEDFAVDNGRGDPHALTRYLQQQETAAAILSGATPSAGSAS